MAITAISPGVTVIERNLFDSVPSVPSTTGAIAGVFRWGQPDQRIFVSSESELVSRFGKPTNDNDETFFSASDFLAYSNSLFVVRVVSDDAYNAGLSNTQIKTEDEADAETSANIIARYPGELGNSLKISICPSTDAFSSEDVANLQVTVGSNTGSMDYANTLAVGDKLRVGNSSIGFQVLDVSAVTANTVAFEQKYRLAGSDDISATRYWGEYALVNGSPTSNNIHIVVIDEDGEITGTAGDVLEVYENVSINSAAKKSDGSTNYYKNIINNTSNWIWATGGDEVATGDASYDSLTGGTDGDNETAISISKVAIGYDKFKSKTDTSVSLIIQGKARSTTLANHIIDNICEVRKDCMAFISPERTDVVNNPGSEADAIISFRNGLSGSSYAVLDTGYKYRYDKYNDVYRYTPLNGDIAGLTARTDNERDPWFSPAGYNRGIIKNVFKLAYNPDKADRDRLYPKDINPVISEVGEGTLLFGDKTLIGDGSPFSRINVRRLFIILEQSIAQAAKRTLFELNNEFTRSNFKNQVNPFLRNVQGRSGIYDFRVVADETNNTPVVIDRNEFIADIYVKPARSINFIKLQFVPVGTGVEFNEIVGQS